MGNFLRVEDGDIYQRLCTLHIEMCGLSRRWPVEERYELGAQIRRSSNSAPANLAEKHGDRHIRNKIEGVNRSRGEAAESVHHLYIAKLKHYATAEVYEAYRARYRTCIRMLNGLERTLETRLPRHERRWRPRTLNPEHSHGA